MLLSDIVDLRARRIWDSRGRPTLEVEVTLACGVAGRGIAPAGASRGLHEAFELRDGTPMLAGLDVQKAIVGIEQEIRPPLIGRDVHDQTSIDRSLIELDGTPNKSRLGGNAIVATSMAVLNAAAASDHMPLWQYLTRENEASLPLPQIQIFGGGAHAGRRIDIQDLMVIATGAHSFQESLVMTAEVYRAAGDLMRSRGSLAGVADEGGWWPAFEKNEQALDTLVGAIEAAGYVPGTDVSIALDVAASEFGSNGRYRLALEGTELDTDGMCELLMRWIEQYPIVSIEDPLAEDDESGLVAFTRAAGSQIQIVGDDYLVTNADKIRRAATRAACNSVLIKPNQVGTITETRAAIETAKRAGFSTIVSARSGETEDTTIVHLATGLNAGQLKVGSFARSERMAKWNEGVRIETGRDKIPPFAGASVLAGRNSTHD
ncbi:MAG TPA: phosphopyruvate hydratase [Acidobacteriaceae bacterium]|nr:phosphopyruvate hydratase [Acidobacteriaceae bacterium]